MSTPAHRSAGPRDARRSQPPCHRSWRVAARPATARAARQRPSRPRPSRRRTRRATRAAYRCRVRPRPARSGPARPSRRCAGPRCHAMSRWRQAAPSRSGRQRYRGCFLSAPTRSPATGGSEGDTVRWCDESLNRDFRFACPGLEPIYTPEGRRGRHPPIARLTLAPDRRTDPQPAQGWRDGYRVHHRT